MDGCYFFLSKKKETRTEQMTKLRNEKKIQDEEKRKRSYAKPGRSDHIVTRIE
jgi:hypothetical protein